MDARGFPRFVDGDASGVAQLDIGAVEAGPLFTVTTQIDEFDLFGGGSGLSLREALLAVNTTPGKRISFAPGLTGATLTLALQELAIPATPGLFIDGSSLTTPATISGDSQFRVFDIPATATVAMHSVKIVDGNAGGEDGGGILNAGTCTVMSSTLSLNSADGGGGIANNGTCTVMSSTLGGNSGTLGGGILNNGTCGVISSTLSGNLAGVGVIYNVGTCSVLSSTLSGNSATLGSGIYNVGTCKLTSTIVAGNFPDNVAGSYTGSTNLIGLDPLLAPLGDYGGPTQTMPPLRGSLAIDAGAATIAQTDQRGGSRSRDGDGDFIALPDIGAVDAASSPSPPPSIPFPAPCAPLSPKLSPCPARIPFSSLRFS